MSEFRRLIGLSDLLGLALHNEAAGMERLGQDLEVHKSHLTFMYTKDLTRPHLKEIKERVNIVKRKRKGLIVT